MAEKEKAITKQLSSTTMVCGEYQNLLEETKCATEMWDERRAESCTLRLVGKGTGDELLCLQATYEHTRSFGSMCTPASGVSLP